jgi:hypothetical protein
MWSLRGESSRALLSEMLKGMPREHPPTKMAANLLKFETPEFTEFVIERRWHQIPAESGCRFGIEDLDSKQPLDDSSSAK